jgi:hypothetical protein
MHRRIEVVVLVCIIGVLVGLYFPFALKVRDTSVYHCCANHLKQIGLALHDHHDTFGSFPQGTIPSRGLATRDRHSWLVSLLPFLEQNTLYSSIDTTKPWSAPVNGKPSGCWVMVFTCPSDPGSTRAVTHYVGMAGVGSDAATLPGGNSRAGFFGYDRKITRDDVTDGLSHTLAVLETSSQPGPWIAGGFSTVRGVVPGSDPYLGPNRSFGASHRPASALVVIPGSPGGLVAFGDASVRFLDGAIQPRIFEALATIAGGEEVGPDF